MLTLLTREKALDFTMQLLTSPAGAQPKDFEELFDRYFQEIPQMQLKMNRQDAVNSDLNSLQQHDEKQQLEREINRVKTDMQG